MYAQKLFTFAIIVKTIRHAHTTLQKAIEYVQEFKKKDRKGIHAR